MNDATRADLLTLATDETAGLQLLRAADEYDGARLLEGLLDMYRAAAREMCTGLGILALAVALEEMAEAETDDDFDPHRDRQEAARLILSFDAAKDCPDLDSALRDFGVQQFNATIDRIENSGRMADVIITIAFLKPALKPALVAHGYLHANGAEQVVPGQ